jgi:hypothetical protein
MTTKQRVIATFETILLGKPVAYSISLSFEPPRIVGWEDDDGETRLSAYGSECHVWLARHQIGEDPLSVFNVKVEMEYNGDDFPSAKDVYDSEWKNLFVESGFTWEEFREDYSSYVDRTHLISNVLNAAGL